MSTLYDDVVSDLYKEAHGFRPSWSWLSQFKACTDEERERIITDLSDTIADEIVSEALSEEQRLFDQEQEIQQMMSRGAEDRVAAWHWILEAEEDGIIEEPDTNYILFCLGLPYDHEQYIREIRQAQSRARGE